MQHFPGNNQAFGDRRNDFASTNILPEFLVYNGVPIIALVTLRDIQPGEQLGYTYGINYWTSRQVNPEIFYPNGEIVPPSEYTPEQLQASYEFLTPT
jgi:hypothetical protein